MNRSPRNKDFILIDPGADKNLVMLSGIQECRTGSGICVTVIRVDDQGFSAEWHYFDHEQASQVRHKPFIEATLLNNGLHSVKRGHSRTDRTNLSLRQEQSFGNSYHRTAPSCWIVVGFSHTGYLYGGTAIATSRGMGTETVRSSTEALG